MFNTTTENDIPVVRAGDVFKIRGCHFQVQEITEQGIFAKGIKRADYIREKLG